MTIRARTSVLLLAAALVGGLAAATVLHVPSATLTTPAAAQDKSPVRVAVQVNENDAKVMNLALNNVANIAAHYKAQGRKVEIQVVAYGPGLHLLRADTSPVKARVAAMSLEIAGLSFNACANTRANMTKQEGTEPPLLSEARLVPSGVVTLIELQQQGFAYLRP